MPDEMIRGLALGGRARVVAAATTETVERLRSIHEPSPTVTAALGRVATGTLLLAAVLEKVTGREPMVTVEIDGDGPAGKLLATASASGWVRATVANPRATAEPRPDSKLDVAAVVGTSGHLVVTRDPGIGEPYRGVVPIVSGEIAKDLAYYLSESEQVPSAVALGVHVLPEARVEHAGGYLVQLLPGVTDDEAQALAGRVAELGAVTPRMREGEGPEAWLNRLFPEGVEILERTSVRFHCGCSRDRVERALKLLGAVEVGRLLDQSRTEPVVLTCEFCRREYTVPPTDLERLLAEIEEDTGTRSGTPAN